MHTLGFSWLKAVLKKRIPTGFAFPYSWNNGGGWGWGGMKFSLQIDLFTNVLSSKSIYNKQAAETPAPDEAG